MYEEFLLQLNNHGGRIRAIAEGAGVDYQWLLGVKSGRNKNPGVKLVEKVKKFMDSPEFQESIKPKI